jgi:hypothetical protein
VEVHYDEGVATHIGPEPCVAVREGGSEASAGERIGQPLSHERYSLRGADAVRRAEGNRAGRVNASASATRRGQRPWHVRTLLAREPGDPTTDHRHVADPVRIGKVRSRSR